MNLNILSVWDKADEIDRTEGALAYTRYNTTLHRVAAHYGFAFPNVVAAFCALSPNNDYSGNLRSTITLLRASNEGIPVEKVHVSTYNACRARAWDFIHGEDFLTRTKGPKTRNFYQNILDPASADPITIDGHMVCVWLGKRMTMVEVAWSKFKYETVANDFKIVANGLGILPNQLQSTLWFTWKRINNVVYKPQLGLFQDPTDTWGLDVQPGDIRPFFPFL